MKKLQKKDHFSILTLFNILPYLCRRSYCVRRPHRQGQQVQDEGDECASSGIISAIPSCRSGPNWNPSRNPSAVIREQPDLIPGSQAFPMDKGGILLAEWLSNASQRHRLSCMDHPQSWPTPSKRYVTPVYVNLTKLCRAQLFARQDFFAQFF